MLNLVFTKRPPTQRQLRHKGNYTGGKNKNQLFQALGQKTLSYIDVAQLHKT